MTNSYHAEYQRRRYIARRAAAVAKLGGGCQVCGTTEDLEFHHVAPADKVIEATVMFSKYSQARIDEELAKCVLLCTDHHMDETRAAMSVEHGGGASGKKNCKCRLCKARKAEYMKKYQPVRGPLDAAPDS